MSGFLHSINVATELHHEEEWTGSERHTGIDKRPVANGCVIDATGLVGDHVIDTAHHGGEWQAIYAYAIEDLRWWETSLNRSINPGAFGENLTTSGIDVSGALLGEKWCIGDVVLQVTQPRIPCRVFAGFWQRPELIKEFTVARRPGAYLKVIQSGRLNAGDKVLVLDRPENSISIADAFAVKTGDRTHLQRLTQCDFLSPNWVQWCKDIAT